MKNAFAQLTSTMWAFIALLIVIAGLGGYVVGEKHAASTTAAPSSQHQNAAEAEEEAGLTEDVIELAAKAKPGANGTAGPGAEKLPDGTYDAEIFGPGGPLEKQEDVLNIHRRNPQDPFAIGAVDAPVVISEFSDFECPFCSRFANMTEPTIMKEYVDKGLVRIEWNDFPVNGPNAEAAAAAGRAAAKQGKFNEFKDALYHSTKDVAGHPNYGIEDFVKLAKEAGVPNLDQFRKDATSGEYDSIIQQARAYASGIGINGTPAFFVGDQYVSGAQPTEVFVQVITEQLAKVASGEIEVPKQQKK